jgi:predicted kinase
MNKTLPVVDAAAQRDELLGAQNLLSIRGSNSLSPARGVNLADLVPPEGGSPDWSACLEAIPDLEKLARTPHDLGFHGEGDVWTHTRMVVEALLDSSDWGGASSEDRFVLFMAALLHDIAKPATTVVDPDSGRIGQPGHSARGAVDARVLLWRAGIRFDLREAVCRLIATHQMPFHVFRSHRAGHSPEYLVRKLSHEVHLPHLAALAEADMRGRVYAGMEDVLCDVALFRELAMEEGCYGIPRAFADRFTRLRYFRGEDVHVDTAYHREQGSRVTLMSGLPASGKDTWIESHRRGLPVVGFDDAREELGLRHGKNDGLAAHRVVDRAKELLRRREDFVFNATHLSRQMRERSIDLLLSYGAEVEVAYLEQAEAELLRRNSRRDSTLPNAAIGRMLHRWEVVLPTEAHSVLYLPTQRTRQR